MVEPLSASGAAAAAAAKKTGEALLGESKTQKEQLARLAEDSPDLKAAAHSYAKRVALKQDLVLNLFYKPLATLAGLKSKYFEEQFARDLAAKTATIPDDAMVSPSSPVAIQSLQGLGFSLDEPDLKEMYLNLLATATDSRRSSAAHPAYADIIRQLAGPEAVGLQVALAKDAWPVAELRLERSDQEGYNRILTHVVNFGLPNSASVLPHRDSAIWLDNWSRLGLFSIAYGTYITDDGAYSWCDGHPDLKAYLDGSTDDARYVVEKGILIRTSFGESFARAVSPPPE